MTELNIWIEAIWPAETPGIRKVPLSIDSSIDFPRQAYVTYAYKINEPVLFEPRVFPKA